ncbi:phosphatase [Simiduia litorea]|uniref:phosphatase domain-containing putative toxin n=1 Tax=Simiduia litorea TaxID=1435348 RepID=UPI0036F3812B
MTHPYDVLELENGGQFIFTPCPGTKGSSVSAALQTLSEAKVDAVVTLLSDRELSDLSLTSFSVDMQRTNFAWFQLPIDDDSEPDAAFENAWQYAKPSLLALLNSGKHIAIHCRGGSGRTGLMAAILLMTAGAAWPEVKAQIQSIRPKALRHPAHLSYLQKHFSI